MVTRSYSLLSEGLWVAVMQLAAAAGQLVGIRILTSVLPPDVFGETVLWVGITQLFTSAIANPTMQALLRFYPEYALQNESGLVRTVIRRQLIKVLTRLLPILLAGLIVVLVFDTKNALVGILLTTLTLVEISRTQNLALLNVNHAHRPYGAWIFIEAWARPLCAWLLITIAGIHTAYVIAGYLLASLLSWKVMLRFIPKDDLSCEKIDSGLRDRVWKYTLPLLPLGLLGWISGMSDRYMIGALLSTSDVGLYAAVYSLASRPMLMLGSIIETTLRPLYQIVLIKGDVQQAGRYLRIWLRLVLLGCTAAMLVTWFGHELIAEWLLDEKYRDVSSMMPWIVGGYSLLLISNVAIRICYANEDTRNIFVIETISTLLAMVISYVFILEVGIWGAAMALPLNYGAKMMLSFWYARPWLASANTVKDYR
jgi:O-antigen/teichoic acid export membrane protein